MKLIVILFSFLTMSAGMPVYAATYGFDDLTNNGIYHDTIGQHLSVDVTETTAGHVLFNFENSIDNETGGVIAQIYFSAAPIYFQSVISMGNSTGVIFKDGKGDLPDGKAYVWDISADADKPAPKKGIDAGESWSVTLKLDDGVLFGDMLSAMGSTFLIGLHVQAFGDGSSESLISILNDGGEPPSTINTPIPAAVWLFGSALLGLMGVSRKQKTMVA